MNGIQTLLALAALLCAPSGIPALSQSAWTPGALGHTGFIRGVQVRNAEEAWVTATSGVFATTDGGATWIKADTSGFTDPAGPSDLTLLLSGTLLSVEHPGRASAIVMSTDGGVTWQEKYHIDSCYINGIVMTSATDGVAVGDPVGGYWVVLLTSDGGVTWRPAPSAPLEAIAPGPRGELGWEQSIAALEGGFIWFGTNNSRIYRSKDWGGTWSYSAIPSFDAYGVAFNDPLAGVAALGAGLARTTDGGASWTHIPTWYCNDVFGIHEFYWAVQGRAILESTDNGATWDTAYTGTGNFERIHAALDGDMIVGFAVGGSQTVKFTISLTEVAPQAGIPQRIRLHQNYPNPFNPTTTIKYGLPERSHVTLTIFNTLGQQVGTLVEGEVEAGYHEVKFDASHLPSGVYLYRLQAGNRIEVRKAVLMK